ncbi:HinT-interacting membrane complex lipoprotein P60 [Metamycoplasma orale]|uniref:Lipoprotein n=1 Tax=Metamycoplasma orale TaxID=2121 RepID=A0A448ZX04_METOS|nr:hypothetical protein [Metamycoplasma orale]VEU55633.1 Uncharacterised protein [Metamycoplasma orale]
MKAKKILNLLSLTTLPLAASTLPLISATKCKNSSKVEGNADNNAAYQETVIKKKLSLNKILIDVTSTVLYETYFEGNIDLLPEAQRKSPDEAILKTILNKSTQLSKDFFELFKLFINKKLDSDKQYFSNLRNIFAKANLDVTSFDPAVFNIPNDSEQEFIIKNSNWLEENIRLEIQKQLIIKGYLLKNTESLKKITKNKDGIDIAKSKFKIDEDKTPYNIKELFKALDHKADNLYLLETLVNTPINEEWEFSDTRDMQVRSTTGKISGMEDYNRIAEFNPNNLPNYKVNPTIMNKPWQKMLLVNTGDQNVNLEELRGYKGVISATSGSGELDTTIGGLKYIKTPIFGFVDPNSNKVYSENTFEFNKLVNAVKDRPKPEVEDAAKTKITSGDQKNINDKDIKIDGTTKKEADGKVTFEKTFTLGSKNYTLIYRIKSLEYDFARSKDLNIEWVMTAKKDDGKAFPGNCLVEFSTKLKDLNKPTEDAQFNLDLYKTSIDLYNESTKGFKAKYLVKIAPLFIKDDPNASDTNASGKLTLKDTPWASEDQQNKIALNLITLKGEELFKAAIKYFKEINIFKVDEKTLRSEIRDEFRKLGIL